MGKSTWCYSQVSVFLCLQQPTEWLLPTLCTYSLTSASIFITWLGRNTVTLLGDPTVHNGLLTPFSSLPAAQSMKLGWPSPLGARGLHRPVG